MLQSEFFKVGELSPAIQQGLLSTAAVLAVLGAMRWGAMRMVRRHVDDPELRFRWRKGISYTAVILIVLLVGRIWSSGLQQLGTFLGLMTAALAIALNQPITNLAGWAFILWRRPFRIGDRIEVGQKAGDVVDLRLFSFSLLEIGNWVDADQPTGRIIHVPNGKVFVEAVANYTSGFPFIWNEIPVLLTFESDWEAAKTILSEVVESLTRPVRRERSGETARYAIRSLADEPRVITSVADSGVLLTIRYVCHPNERRQTAEEVWEKILRAFGSRDDIDFAYPTTRLFNNPHEGKPDARAPLS
jgi:small-conductance mechanosensitive channel